MDEKAEEADLIMLPCWQLLKHCMRHPPSDLDETRFQDVPHLLASDVGTTLQEHANDAPGAARLGLFKINAIILIYGLHELRCPADGVEAGSFWQGFLNHSVAQK